MRPPKELLPGLFTMSSGGIVNLFWIIDGNTVTLIDTGLKGTADRILQNIAACGRQPQDVRDILVTHCHRDHAGSLAALKNRTGATTYMHPIDAEMVRQGKSMRPVRPSPTLLGYPMYLSIKYAPAKMFQLEPISVDREINDGEELPIAGGIRAIHVPGHCAGQLAFLWNRHGGVLFAADAAAHVFGLSLSPIYEDLEVGKQSLAKISALTFEHACFGHGRPILGGADKEFRTKFP
jgi:glyoxylase-like metal-dependent hydrolase (beta-lactamase superfamily II)